MNNKEIHNFRIREIPYNYTSFSDREIVIRFLGEEIWDVLNRLRSQRKTGRSARMLFEVLGDMWVITRNPFLQDDLLSNKKRAKALIRALHHRIDQIIIRARNNKLALELTTSAMSAVNTFENRLSEQGKLRIKLFKKLKQVLNTDKIDFSAMARVSHATDASDWRVEYPLAVINPSWDHEAVQIVKKIIELGLTIIPRGGGTGYTGSAVPLFPDTVIINTEKLDFIGDVEFVEIRDGDNNSTKVQRVASVEVGAGVITKDLADFAEEKGYIFAVDPTSQNASTIGGNISMNAGGKKAVKWGTAIDNLLSWKMVGPDAEVIVVERLNHNRGKIHDQKTAAFAVKRYESDGKTLKKDIEYINLPGKDFRKEGLGKDVTDKVLGNLPGIQKEGCDGIITSARFILHVVPAYTFTVCIEFFDPDLTEAVKGIEKIIEYLKKKKNVFLAALEHLDERYIKAIKYNARSNVRTRPKMVLLADISGDSQKAVHLESQNIIAIFKSHNAHCFVASSKEARQNFWLDRSRTAAIAAHTNAFKINEDVVIPIHKLAEYNNGIERINIEFSLKNKIRIVEELINYFQGEMGELWKLKDYTWSAERERIINAKIKSAQNHLLQVKFTWRAILKNLDHAANKHPEILKNIKWQKGKSAVSFFHLLQRRKIVISYRQSVEEVLFRIFSGSELEDLRLRFSRIHSNILCSRLFVATHMHAGDGNVHTNIPVNSSDYFMIKEANEIVERIMALVKSLGGVISGEHGIGLTKYEFLEKSKKSSFERYKSQVDPKGQFNRGKLLPGADLSNAYTPSFRLLRQEALIMEQSELEALNNNIKNCLRCGKCKYVCTTHVPKANLSYSPRNKILATSLLMEAFLYEEQTRRGVSTLHFRELGDLSEHCTVCHKCKRPCPVDIDFGDVSCDLRKILKNRKKIKLNLGKELSIHFLNQTEYKKVQFIYLVFLKFGFRLQRFFHKFRYLYKNHAMAINKLTNNSPRECSPTHTSISFFKQINHSLKRPLPRLPKNTMRSQLGLREQIYLPIIGNSKKESRLTETVLYFPGCGSERLYSDISLAALALLYDLGVSVALPPKFLCCGYPQLVNGKIMESKKITVDNSVIFHRMANTLNYLDIKTVLISCGTCLDQLEKYELENIFPGSTLKDVHGYLFDEGVKAKAISHDNYIYHDPCHSPLKHLDKEKIVRALLSQDVVMSEFCCGESGTFALSRPDISGQVKFKKEEEIQRNLIKRQAKHSHKNNNAKMVTTCPSCFQGLSRFEEKNSFKTSYIIEELAKRNLGNSWKKDFIKKVKKDGIEKVLL